MHDMLGLLGLCFRAGRLVCGDDAVADTVSAGEARLLLLAGDAGAGICRRVAYHQQNRGVPVVRMDCSAAEMGQALGRRPTAVCCITDAGFAAAAAQKAAAADETYAALAQQLGEKKKRVESRRGHKKPRKKSAGKHTSGNVRKSTDTKRGGERA
ncbi:MAG: ribosomal L7Ae/L30e/S12e/Gadd45 family protein [Eubacteriales bacterium]|nr:ribosomal L7Ae/L30e/S12e/Gadd45 family protein [Eubacteriales bacterium]